MKKIYTIALLLMVVNTVFGQLSRDLDAFRQLEVTDKINVVIIPNTFDKIIIEGELANQLELTQVSDVLRLKMTGSYIMQGNKVEVTLYSSKVSSIIARKGAKIIQDKGRIKDSSISLSANEGGRIEVDVQAVTVKAAATAGGYIEVKGTGISQDIDVAFGGNYFAKNLKSESAIVNVSGGGRAVVNVSKKIDAETRAGGFIEVYGNPKDRKQRKLAGGKINYL